MLLCVSTPSRYIELLAAIDAFVVTVPQGTCATCGRSNASVEYARESCCATSPELQRLEEALEDVRLALIGTPTDSHGPCSDDLVEIGEAALLLGLSTSSVRSRIHRGTLRIDARGVRGVALFRRETLAAQKFGGAKTRNGSRRDVREALESQRIGDASLKSCCLASRSSRTSDVSSAREGDDIA